MENLELRTAGHTQPAPVCLFSKFSHPDSPPITSVSSAPYNLLGQSLGAEAEGPLLLLGGAGSAVGASCPRHHLSAAMPTSRQVYVSALARQAPMNHPQLHVVTLAGNRGPVCSCAVSFHPMSQRAAAPAM